MRSLCFAFIILAFPVFAFASDAGFIKAMDKISAFGSVGGPWSKFRDLLSDAVLEKRGSNCDANEKMKVYCKAFDLYMKTVIALDRKDTMSAGLYSIEADSMIEEFASKKAKKK